MRALATSDAIHYHINDFLVRTGLRGGVRTVVAMFYGNESRDSADVRQCFAVTHHAFSSGAGRTSDGNGSHASTLKSPSYTKSVSWQHYPPVLNWGALSVQQLMLHFLPTDTEIIISRILSQHQDTGRYLNLQ